MGYYGLNTSRRSKGRSRASKGQGVCSVPPMQNKHGYNVFYACMPCGILYSDSIEPDSVGQGPALGSQKTWRYGYSESVAKLSHTKNRSESSNIFVLLQ